MIKKAQFSIDFDLNDAEKLKHLESTKVDFLPCNFKPDAIVADKKKDSDMVNAEHNQQAFKCKREVYFDPCIKKIDDELSTISV